MSSVLETLSLNELITRKEHLLKQLEKVEIQIENVKKNNEHKNNEHINNEHINNEQISSIEKINIKTVKIKINVKKKI